MHFSLSFRIYFSTIIIYTLCPFVAIAHDLLPIAKEGSCPSGYTSSGYYCVPGVSATYAIKKIGGCPSGYRGSGKYCVAAKVDTKLAIIKIGSCPVGYYTAGEYCLKN